MEIEIHVRIIKTDNSVSVYEQDSERKKQWGQRMVDDGWVCMGANLLLSYTKIY